MAEKKIGGRTYKVVPLLATDALRLQARLLKALGPAVERLPTILKGAGSEAGSDAKAASDAAAVAALIDVIGGIDAEATPRLIKDIVEVAMIQRGAGNYEQVDLDHDFTDNLKDIIPVVVFVLQEQFGDFFGALLAGGLPDRLARV